MLVILFYFASESSEVVSIF